MGEELAPDCNFMHRIALMHELDNSSVEVHTSTRCIAFQKDGVTAVNEDGAEQFFDGDCVICAMGLSPCTREAAALRGLVANTIVIGDCVKPGRILHATRAGWSAACYQIL